jgi:glyoxylase-like metal-dependent hydrolase (beta-lactamase superfamily II)/rhodanese-related sulfurtransferase
MKKIISRMILVCFFIMPILVGADQVSVRSEQVIQESDDILQAINKKITNINTLQLKQLLEKTPETVVIDVRTADEIARLGGMIEAPRNYNIIRGWLEFRVGDIVTQANTPIVVYCGTNLRSPLAAKTLMDMGYSNVKNYSDGFFAWQKAGLPVEQTDKAVDSILYSKPQKVTDSVWSAIGATAPPTYANSGHNNNLSFIITSEGVVVINAGDNYLLAQALHSEIKKITKQPVRYVVLENGQGHAAMGALYWKQQNVPIIAHVETLHELEEYGEEILARVQKGRRDKSEGSEVVLPDETFTDKKVIELGGQRIELLHLGPAHSPGDIMVWLPQQKLVISGDMAFHQRLLPVTEHTDTAAWIQTWDKFAALNAEIVIPGHGVPTTMSEVTKYTKDYLVFMREKIAALIDSGETLEAAAKIDQSAYRHLDTFDELAALNASTIFRAMEFE